jgi:hypothetical protein
MPFSPSNPDVKTVGTAPKVTWITIAAIALGVLVALADKLFLGDDIEDAVWQTLLAFSIPAFLVGRGAPAALQEPKLPVSEHSSATTYSSPEGRR